MKKIAALLCVLVGAMLFSFAGCSGGTFTEKSYASGGAAIEKVTVQVSDRELEIGASQDGQVHIDYFDSEKEYLDISLSGKELTVKLTVRDGKILFAGMTIEGWGNQGTVDGEIIL